jgi:hypothetical protein
MANGEKVMWSFRETKRAPWEDEGVLLTEDESQECQAWYQSFLPPEKDKDGEWWVHKDVHRLFVAKFLMGRARRFLLLAGFLPSALGADWADSPMDGGDPSRRDYAENVGKAVEAAAKASALHPLSINLYDFACVLRTVGYEEESKATFAEFLRRHREVPVKPFEKVLFDGRDMKPLVRDATNEISEQAHGDPPGGVSTEIQDVSLHEFGRVQAEPTTQRMREDREVGSSCEEGPSDEQSRRIDESTTLEQRLARLEAEQAQLTAFDNRFDFDAAVLTWRFVHQALEIALSKGYTSTEIARSFTRNLAQAIAECGAILPESAERRIALSATGLAWRGIHSTLLCSLVRRETLPHPEVMDECAQHIRSFTDRLEVALVDWGVLSIAQVNEIRQESLTALFEATTIHHGGALPVMTQAIWENEYGGTGLPTEAEIRDKHVELQTEIKQREFFAKALEERGKQATGKTGARLEEIRDEDIPF